MNQERSNTILVVGDCHVDEEQSLDRFNLLGNFILQHQPTHIVFIGDFLTLNCLSAWDKDKRLKMEGKRYKNEIDAGNEALDRTFYPMLQYNHERRESKKKLYQPEIIYIEGNHEDRLTRYLERDPTFSGWVDISTNLHLIDRGIRFVPYREYVYIGGIGFTHVPFNKISPISGLDIARKASLVTVDSVVYGHTHEANMSNVHKQGQTHLQQIYNCGCFIDKKEDYVHGRVTNYWRGITLLHNWKHGRFDVEQYSLGRLKREYEH